MTLATTFQYNSTTGASSVTAFGGLSAKVGPVAIDLDSFKQGCMAVLLAAEQLAVTNSLAPAIQLEDGTSGYVVGGSRDACVTYLAGLSQTAAGTTAAQTYLAAQYAVRSALGNAVVPLPGLLTPGLSDISPIVSTVGLPVAGWLLVMGVAALVAYFGAKVLIEKIQVDAQATARVAAINAIISAAANGTTLTAQQQALIAQLATAEGGLHWTTVASAAAGATLIAGVAWLAFRAGVR